VALALKDKVAWLSGATGAIGQAIAHALAREGAIPILSSRSREKLDALAAAVSDRHGCRAVPIEADVTSTVSVESAARGIVDEFGRIDCLVNSTSVSLFGDFLSIPDDDWLAVYQGKVFGYMRAMRAALPHMIRLGSGCIVNISGRGGHQPTLPTHLPGMSANAAINLMTKGLANMYGAHGIRINCVAPGPVRSPRYDSIVETNRRLGDDASHPTTSQFNVAAPLKQFSSPEEIADVVLFLLGDRSRIMTGIVLQADGGGTASL
jgi:3-oxoacyl-[acyl-carrier protein] reductase